MHQDSLEPAVIRFTLERLQESARQSGYFLPAFFMYLYPQELQRVTYYLEVLLVQPNEHCYNIVSEYNFDSHIFIPSQNILNGEQHEKHVYRRYGILACQIACSDNQLVNNNSPSHDVSLCFIYTLLVLFQAKNCIRSTPASAALTQLLF